MAVTVTTIKKTRTQAVFKFVGDGAANVTHLTAKLADETLDLPNISMPITNVVWSSSDASVNPVVIKRDFFNPANAYILHSSDNWALSQVYGAGDYSNASSNISVFLPATGATLFLTISKPAGFVEPNLQANVYR
jgi:hypothetical protein